MCRLHQEDFSELIKGFLVAFNPTYQTDFSSCLWRLHHTKVLALLSNGSRFSIKLERSWGCVSRFGNGFRHIVCEVHISNDEDIMAVKTHSPVQVPVGPVMRARAKRFKEELNNLARRVPQQKENLFTTEGLPYGVQFDLSNGFSIPFVASSPYQGSCFAKQRVAVFHQT
ncbi:hypothetical protein PanWU01x14_002310 [Parasponia andersonii]|uniref:Uncharacterized protein n=1 Tax=Parasponia andersonii TaxID=3476 RepID=A0A2P5E541_PARAD|nr:hypothetical protein PanWU01x14_002310 [Parasponia andersonii]